MEVAPKYEVGETVLCFNRNLMYEAKVEKVELRGVEFHYFIHYKNWKKK
jgi:hypothetical protein